MDSTHLQLEMFGGFRADVPGRGRVELPHRQAGILLAFLALRPHRAYSRDELAELFWPELDSEVGRRSLRQALYALRGLLKELSASSDGLLLTDRAKIQLNSARLVTDVLAFERTAEAAAAAQSLPDRLAALTQAAELYRAELLPGFYQDAICEERNRLAEMNLEVRPRLARALEESGKLEEAIRIVTGTVALDPLAEEAHRDLIRLYGLSGRPTAGVRQYRVLERILQEELDANPSEATRRLVESLHKSPESPESLHKRSNGARAVPALNPVATLSPRAAAGGPAAEAPRQPDPVDPPLPAIDTTPYRPTWRRPAFAAAGGVLMVLMVLLQMWQNRPGALRAHGPAGEVRRGREAAPGGRELWVARYERLPGDGDSEPTDAVTDAAGNVYVTGFIQTAEHDVDFLTIKYDPSGRKLWEARYNGPGNDVDRARSIAVDALGNVYVTGDSDSGRGNGSSRLSGLDYATVKYGPDGKQQWASRYNGPDNGEDFPVKVAVGPAGEVYVTGSVWGRHGVVASTDYATVKYDAAGALQWARPFDQAQLEDRAVDLAVSPSGDVVVTGHSQHVRHIGPDTDYVTLAYSPGGDVRWRRSYGGPNDGGDLACALAVDAEGCVYVLGRGYNGDPAFGGTKTDYVTVKYDRWGTEKWVRSYDGSGWRLDDKPAVIAVGPSGQTYVAGESPGEGIYPDVHTLAYDASGNLRWARTMNGNGSRDDVPYGIAVDPAGNVIVAGRTFGRKLAAEGTEDDYLTLKYGPSGELLWLRIYNSPSGGGDYATAVTTDAAGNVVVTGRAYTGAGWDILTLKYSP
ncbi:MAG: BTAD domain-containing putative transcriptional regulator [Actinomycetota bacterium]